MDSIQSQLLLLEEGTLEASSLLKLTNCFLPIHAATIFAQQCQQHRSKHTTVPGENVVDAGDYVDATVDDVDGVDVSDGDCSC